MSKTTTARTNYDAARAELLTRVRLRDQVLLIYLGFAGAIFGVSLASTGVTLSASNHEILLVLPFLSLGFSILVSQHNAVIGAIILFNTNEINAFLAKHDEGAPEFTSSLSFKGHSPRSNLLRLWGHTIILLVPCIVSLAVNICHVFKPQFPFWTAWWFALACTIGTVLVIFHVHKLRETVYEDIIWHQ
jgi:hypothetical protein